MSNFRSFIKDTSIYVVGDALGKGMAFFSLLVYSRLLTKEDIGIYGYVLIITLLLESIISLGIPHAYNRYFFEANTDEQKSKFLSTALTVANLSWLVLFVFLMLFDNQINEFLFSSKEYSSILFWGWILINIRLNSGLIDQTLRNMFYTKKITLYNGIKMLLIFVFTTLLLLVAKIGVLALFISLVIGDILILPFKLRLIKNFSIRFFISKEILKKFLHYGLPVTPSILAFWGINSVDRFMLKQMVSLEAVGILTVAVSFVSIFKTLLRSIESGWWPHLTNSYETDKDKKNTALLIERFFKLLLFLSMVTVLLTSFIGSELISFLFGKQYNSAFLPMLILVIGQSFNMTISATSAIISLKKKMNYILYVSTLSFLLNIGANYLLIPILAEVGAATATALSFFTMSLCYGLASKRFSSLVRYDYFLIGLNFLVIFASLFLWQLNLEYRLTLLGLFLLFFCIPNVRETLRRRILQQRI